MAADAFEIDTWLMSCRVLKRGVEQFLLNHLIHLALSRGIQRIRGVYIPTSKNALVRDHFIGLGFTNIAAEPDGREASWELCLSDNRALTETFIKESPLMESLEHEVQHVFRNVFADDGAEITGSTTASDVDGWDSLAHLNLIVALEKRFGIKFATAEISRLKNEGSNVGHPLDLLRAKLV